MICSTNNDKMHILDEHYDTNRKNNKESNMVVYRCFYDEYNKETGIIEEKYREFKGRASINAAKKFFTNYYVKELIRYKGGKEDLIVTNQNKAKHLNKPIYGEYSPKYIKSVMVGTKAENKDKIIDKIGIDNMAKVVNNQELLETFKRVARSYNDEDPETAAELMLKFYLENNI